MMSLPASRVILEDICTVECIFHLQSFQPPDYESKFLHTPPYIVKSFFLENQGFFNLSSINISEEGAIGMDISLYLVRK